MEIHMHFSEKWIWLPRDRYLNRQHGKITAFRGAKPWFYYTVADFKKSYSFEKEVSEISLRVSADTSFVLYLNGEAVCTGPASVGGDALRDVIQKPNYYATAFTLKPNSRSLEFFASVKLHPTDLFEFSKGHGGFMLTGHVTFTDGTKKVIMTDTTWFVRLNSSFVSPGFYDGRLGADEFVYAEECDNIWLCETSPLPPREEKNIFPEDGGVITVAPHEKVSGQVFFDRIYAGYVHIKAKSCGEVSLEMEIRELDEEPMTESFIFMGDDEYRGFKLHSVGNYSYCIENRSEEEAALELSLINTHHPVDKEAKTTTSDSELNLVLDVCRHTLKQCRQTLHLDSPKHCEPLMCTGDYYVETLMSVFSFGDMRLAEFDIRRTAELFRQNDGRIFHTTYSLIWVKWLYDVYMLTGNAELLHYCEDALLLLLDRFETYVGDNGIIENPPDYMFVDWIYIDGWSLHHPPKALGQSCLNMYYYTALDHAEKIYRILGDDAMARYTEAKKYSLRDAINSVLYDGERGLYFEGLNTKTPEHLLDSYSMPQNTDKRYYLKQSNILAASFGVCDDVTGREILRKIMTDECKGDYQPYFAHYLLEAIYRLGLRDEYTMKAVDRWREPVRECSKGLAEGFLPPEPTYKFDHSHAWGGSPLYSVPKALLGFEIVEAGMKEISLSPSLLGLESATVELPTPFGTVTVVLERGKAPVINAPEGIRIKLN